MTESAIGGSAFKDTIFALSSGTVPSAIAIVRISGAATRSILQSMSGGLPQPRQAGLGDIRDQAGERLDRGLILFFPGPASFTGEDCAELHLHGGQAVVAAVLAALGTFGQTRPAEAGEFTRRAFLNGKIDLPGAEALADLVHAQTQAQRRFALANGAGRQQELYESWRRRLIGLQARIEADLDFSDQEDVPESLAAELWVEAETLESEITSHVAGYRRAEIIRNGFKVVILGAPNAGKSSFLNALARREVAIVTDEAGTTRDVLEVSLDIDGAKVVLFDTAGLREARGKVEAIGIERALERARAADLLLVLEDMATGERAALPDDLPAVVRIGTKSDLVACAGAGYGGDMSVSAKTGAGLDRVIEFLGERAASVSGVGYPLDMIPFRNRHVHLLNEAARHLSAVDSLRGSGIELVAEELRLAASQLGRISGAIGAEDVLDAVFSQFCIGK